MTSTLQYPLIQQHLLQQPDIDFASLNRPACPATPPNIGGTGIVVSLPRNTCRRNTGSCSVGAIRASGNRSLGRNPVELMPKGS